MMLLVPRHTVGSRLKIDLLAPEGTDRETMLVQVRPRATFAQLPASRLRDLGYEPTAEADFVFPDGSTGARAIGRVRAKIFDDTRWMTCVFDEDNGMPSIGMVTLGEFALEFNPDYETNEDQAYGTTR